MPRAVTLPPDQPPAADGAKAGGWWHESEDGKHLVCDLCPRGCVVGPGKRGFCFVRQNRDGQMVSTTYGRSTGFCVDPIEKKPLNQFYPGTAVLSFGTAGCNLGCKFCQNWSMSRSRDVDAACEVADPETIARAAVELGCRSVAFTYNDPIIWAEYAIDTALACHQLGVKTVAVTSGYISPGAWEAFYGHMDAANVDLKAFSEEFYRDLTGGHLQPVLDTLRWLVRQGKTWVEITNLIIPGENDSPEELGQMCQWIFEELGAEVPLHFSAFHPDFKLTDHAPTPLQTLLRAHEIARQAGLRYVYTGNISDREHQSTYCPGCGRVVIQRDGYSLGVYEVREGRCRHCQAEIAGRFDPQVGTWGGRRLPVHIAFYARPKESVAIPKEDTKVANTPAGGPNPGPEGPVRPQLTDEQEQLVFQAAGRRVAATVHGARPEAMDAVLGDAAGVPLYGAFVSLKRGGQLRSCCGSMGQSIPLSEAVDRAAERAAKDDPRFPPISAMELDHLDMEVWLLWGLRPMTARGEDRVKEVTIGKHGLQIARGQARGLLLPGVAVEHNLDAKGFLKQVCLKAGLPPDAWREDDTALMTFEGYAIQGRLNPGSGPEEALPGGPTQAEVAALAEFARGNILALLQGATPTYYMPGGFDGGVSGLALTLGELGSGERIEASKLAPRPELPLQSTLFNLIWLTARALMAQQADLRAVPTMPLGLSVLFDPAMHGTAAEPELQGVDPKRRAVLALDSSRSVWVYDPQLSAQELLAEAVEKAAFSELAAANVMSMAVVSTEPRVCIAHLPRPEAGTEVRPPAVAGMFYPGSSEDIDRALDEMLPGKRKPEPWPAVMVPHAGWTYSGRLAAEVFSRVAIPEQVIIFCPKHRPGGSEWAVAPHRVWSLPGRQVESDPELAQRLAEAVSGLELDAVAHRQEHAIEVQLPLIARLAPRARVVGIVIGGGELSGLLRFGEQLAALLRDMPQQPLLVISSDMSHMEGQADNEAEARRLDRMVLDAMQTLDPARLYKTVRDNRISMCGMSAAVIVMETLRQRGCLSRCESVGYATSADASGDYRRVVGYAGMLLG